ncbi:MAG: SpaA isopeptide-forming pilin-related protein [Lachnospiraceae bacterium]|nr:SpaA isopeptide-forming pilin-related protein [Lachnospiraceae bacterium]
MKKHKIISLVLAALLLLSSASSGLGIAQAANTGTTENKQSAAYFLVKETSDGSWLTKYNWIHYITIGGTKYPAYCVESSRTNPLDGATYEQIDSSSMGYSSTALSGLREIVRNGYPYSTKINGTSLSAEQAQAATQMAIRMWLSYRKEQEGASYNVSGMYNPEPAAGNVRIKAGTASGATDVYNAAIALYKIAKSGSTTTFSVAATSTGSVTFPTSTSDPYYHVQIRVTMTGCDYATLTGLPSDVTILAVTSGTKTQIKNGAVVTLQVPESYAGKTLQYTLTGYSNKGNTSLQFYRSSNSPNSYQRLFVPVSSYASVTGSGGTYAMPTYSRGSLKIHKTDVDTGTALSGAVFAFYEWSASKNNYVLSEDYVIQETEEKGTYTLFLAGNSDGKAQILYTTENLGKIKVVETKAPAGYSNIDPATGQPYEWERQFTNDGEVHTITIDAVNERAETDAYLCLYKESDANQPLSGVKFSVYSDEVCKTLLQTISTDASGYAISTAIPVQIGEERTVYVRELYQGGSYGGGYYLPDDTVYTVTLTEANTEDNPARVGGEDFVIVNQRRLAYLELTKLRDDTDAPIKGVRFKISQTATMDAVIETITTDANGYAKSAAINIPAEGYTVYVQEVPQDGYVPDDTVYAVKLYSDRIAVVNDGPIYNTPTKVELSKTDLVTGQEIPDAKMRLWEVVQLGSMTARQIVTVTTEDGQTGTSWITTGEVTKIYAQLKAGATYILEEIAAPDGYLIAHEVEFTVNADGSITKVHMEDDCTKVLVRKVTK